MPATEQAVPAVSTGCVALRGSFGDKPSVMTRLQTAGVSVVSLTKNADVVLVEGDASSNVQSQASKHGKEVMQVTEYLAALSLTEAASATPLEELPRKPAIEVTETTVRILDIIVPRRKEAGRLTPGAGGFAHFSFDAPTLKTARAVALAYAHGMPCLLEGETATAKTATIKWVAHLTNNDLVRINLNGQTDTSELVGRYVPAKGLPRIDIWKYKAFIDGSPNIETVKLEQESEDIILSACAANDGKGRELTEVEIQQIAANEKLSSPSWEFQEGSIPGALRKGYWVIMDEVNLAEAQILERLNPVLERPPSIVLTEGDGTMIGGRGEVPVHDDFRMFATMNPASYAGRSAMSPAYRDRWQVSRFVETPGEAEFHQMLRRLVFGEQPEVVWNGVRYQSEAGDPIYPELQKVNNIDAILEGLALFHSMVCAAAGMGDNAATIGRTRRERYVFTRRTLLSTLELIHRHQVVLGDGSVAGVNDIAGSLIEDVVENVYVSRLQEAADQQAVRTAMRAAGLTAG